MEHERGISRREFVKTSFVGTILTGLTGKGAGYQQAQSQEGITAERAYAHWKPGDPIGYIRPEAPKFELPMLRGKRYDARIPDTLDLAERARLGVNVLTGALDPLADDELYFRVAFNRNPVIMWHDFSDLCDVKFLEAQPLMRAITGSDLNRHVDRKLLSAKLRMVGPDGLLWEPKRGRPWIMQGVASMGYDGDFTRGDRFFVPLFNGRFLGVVSLYYSLTGDALWRRVGEGIVNGYGRMVVYRDDYAFFQTMLYGPETSVNPAAPAPQGVQAGGLVPWVIQGLSQFYRITRYEPARELAEKLIRGFRYHGGYYGPDGEFISDHPHHHCHDIGLLAMTDYATTVGDHELLEFCRKGYEHGRSLGVPLIGYFPEVYNSPTSTCETCEVADMIGLAIKLSQAGVADYWDDADRYLRNQFAEMQLTQTDWISAHARTLNLTPVKPNETADRVPERNRGAFAGWASGNEWWANGPGIMHCCTGNATRAIYYAWESIVQSSEGRLRVNLLLNRASPWADIDSYIPYVGRVDVRIKQPCHLEVRLPEWTTPEQIQGYVDGKSRALTFTGRYAQVGPTKAGETATLSFPIHERTVDGEIATRRYRLTLKGNDVVDIDPPGKLCPLYQRAYYRTNEARWKTAERFVPEQNLRW